MLTTLKSAEPAKRALGEIKENEMIAINESQELYLASFAQLEKKLPGSNHSWLARLRQEAIHRFGELGFPTTRNEEWKYTNVAPIAHTAFQPGRHEPSGLVAEKVGRLALAGLDCTRLVFINGRYSPDLSRLGALPAGVKAGSLASALRDGAPQAEEHLARYAAFHDRAFVALNTAFLDDGAFVEIPKGIVLERPIALLFLSTGGLEPTVSHPRNLIVVGRQSQATLIEAHVGLEDGVYFTNAVTEVASEDGAVVEYSKIQQESEKAFHVATLWFQNDRNCSLNTHSIVFGGLLSREDLVTVLNGEGGDSQINGLYVTAGEQHVDNHTVIDHAKPHCSSREVYKGVLEGRSQGVFNGKIIVRKDAQKTDAKQSNKNLLLSEDAVINTKPQLEIYADDVKCTHGATIGQIDPEALFYLRSRGIGQENARRLLTQAFANDILVRIKLEPLRARLAEELAARWTRGRSIKEA